MSEYIDPKKWKGLMEAKKRAEKARSAPKKESSGDSSFDKAILRILKDSKPKK